MITKEEFGHKIKQPAIQFQIGGFRPDNLQDSSWIGKVMLANKDEDWPYFNGEPMKPLCQLNLSQLDYLPESLKEIDFITVFLADENELPYLNVNGDRWLIRSYTDIKRLTPVNIPNFESEIKAFQLFPELIQNDYPNWEDCPLEIPEEFKDNYHELFPNKSGFKIGKWPTLIQGQIFSGIDPSNKTNFAFQIDSVVTDKAKFYIGDSGIAYFGVERIGDEHKWSMTWQSM